MPVRVLVVDDDEMSRELLTVLLEAEDYAVETAESGEAALARLEGSAAAPDVVLTDMQMPGITGPALAGRLRSVAEGSVVLAMSGSQPAQDALAAFDGFLLKPFKVAQLTAEIDRIQQQRRRPTPGKVVSISAGAAPAPKPDAPAQPAILNDTIYEQLRRTIPPPQLGEMYTLCINDARERIRRMRSSAEQHDADRFVREAHAIKGSAGMLGATELHTLASELEIQGLPAEGGTSEAVNSLDELARACDRLERMLGSRA